MVSGKTSIFGLIGDPIQHSLSPKMHNTAFQHLKLDSIYVAFRVKAEDLSDAVRGLRALNVKGFNVTAPHKESVIPLLDQLSEESAVIGAVNTVKNEDGILTGYNTDGGGFTRFIKEQLKVRLQGKKVVMVGLGGAAKSIAYYLCKENIKSLIISNRNQDKAQKYSELLKKKFNIAVTGIPLEGQILNAFMKKCDLLIYGLPMDVVSGGELIIDPDVFPSNMLLFDLRYHPKETQVMKLAREKGLSSYNGEGMLLYQGVQAFQVFTGLDPSEKLMKASLET
ncbi:shikimate dehydrogenase [Candidatus Contubernalis alkaliaceticus]|uniref:shikimate dehydrogenase n=1 Tax=Candidatus Contubernalis alkaliaceticus TaxID=338645 RepID=UPI001F4C472F|nr:shikimate dehydrogenase [Candidatus Contubernalis alkalaceticus]UNC92576.1 shikimate dehydrogenase [Candidatus Contubernalis alkalaceticus]